MNGLSRRSFAESLAVAALAPLIGVPPESIQLASWADASKGQPLGDDTSALAKALADVVRSQYGSRLTAADLATVTRQIRTGLERVDRLRKVDLSNGDEPDFVFTAHRRSPPPS
jgi:hypothetical protein